MAPRVDWLDPATAVVGDPALTLRVRGAGFDAASVIVWNGGDEPTTVVGPGECTTIIQPVTASGPGAIPVAVRDGTGVVSAARTFLFVAAGPAPPMYVDPADVFARLRIVTPDVHPDHDYIVASTLVANELVRVELDRGDPAILLPLAGPPWPEPVWRAALGVAIRVYRFKDADTDVSEAWDAMGAPALRIPRDPLAGYRDFLTPYMPGSSWAPA